MYNGLKNILEVYMLQYQLGTYMKLLMKTGFLFLSLVVYITTLLHTLILY